MSRTKKAKGLEKARKVKHTNYIRRQLERLERKYIPVEGKTSITKKESSTGVTENAAPTFNATTANFNVALKEPGDYAVYTVTVANTGTLDAVLRTITETPQAGGSDAIQYTLTPAAGSEQGSTLAKTTGTHSFDVKVEYLSTAVGENAPDANSSKTYTVTLNYEQPTT